MLTWCNTARSFEQWSIPNFSNAFSFWEILFFFWPLFQIAFAPQVSRGHHADLARRRKRKYSSIWPVESGSSALARLVLFCAPPKRARNFYQKQGACRKPPKATVGSRVARWSALSRVRSAFLLWGLKVSVFGTIFFACSVLDSLSNAVWDNSSARPPFANPHRAALQWIMLGGSRRWSCKAVHKRLDSVGRDLWEANLLEKHQC